MVWSEQDLLLLVYLTVETEPVSDMLYSIFVFWTVDSEQSSKVK